MDISAARLRALRAALFTALCLTLSAASHVLLSGRPLPLPTVAAASVAVFATAYALAGRERGFGHIAALLVPLELAADALFTTGQRTCYGADGRPVPGALTALCGGGGIDGPFAPVTGPGTASWLLLAAHLAVGLLAAAWLRRGEAALARLLRAVAALAFRPLLLAVTAAVPLARPGGPRVRAVRHARVPAAPPLLLHSVVRRGPPLGLALA
ncbi:hypothetical protein [Streptomyces netropsis]|uniref:Integral membrane protein n=1 Tax=Streptomyces netropsis TaxID=55404 RepID=A0A7W7PD62_STRNE|nr:hypothetical protein [Streptomyces netropsis]MBB4884763.1 hypothetical protein [Streptomyces netropsis]GGR01464.1 hypothetical protein GCM10010219_01440 [Streptomyces netropsis]